MEGADPKERLRGTYVEALKKNWMVWPAVQAVNFKFVPLEHRVLVVNVVSLGELRILLLGGFEERDYRDERIVLIYVCVCLYRMELLFKLREQSGREREIRGCVRERGMSVVVVMMVVMVVVCVR